MVQMFGNRVLGGIGAPGGGMAEAFGAGGNTAINQRNVRQSMDERAQLMRQREVNFGQQQEDRARVASAFDNYNAPVTGGSRPGLNLEGAFGKPPLSADTVNLAPIQVQLRPVWGQLETENRLPQGYLERTAALESSFDPNAQNAESTAGGLFQFLDATAKQYGLTNKLDPMASSAAAAKFAADNAAYLRRTLGREPTGGELYLAHQQGAGGAVKLLANPNVPAAQIVGMDAVRLNGGTPDMTAGEFANLWITKWTGQGPQQPSDTSQRFRPMEAPAEAPQVAGVQLGDQAVMRPAGLQQAAPQGPMDANTVKMQIQQFAAQNPRAVIVRGRSGQDYNAATGEPLTDRIQESQGFGAGVRDFLGGTLDAAAGVVSSVGSGVIGAAADVVGTGASIFGADDLAAKAELVSDVMYNTALLNLRHGYSATQLMPRMRSMFVENLGMEPAEFNRVMRAAEAEGRRILAGEAATGVGVQTPGPDTMRPRPRPVPTFEESETALINAEAGNVPANAPLLQSEAGVYGAPPPPAGVMQPGAATTDIAQGANINSAQGDLPALNTLMTSIPALTLERQSLDTMAAQLERSRRLAVAQRDGAALTQVDAQLALVDVRRRAMDYIAAGHVAATGNFDPMAAALSDMAGVPVEITPMAGGLYRISAGGQVIADGIDGNTMVNQYMLGVNDTYKEQVAAAAAEASRRDNAWFDATLEAWKKSVEQEGSSAAAVTLETVKKQLDQVFKGTEYYSVEVELSDGTKGVALYDRNSSSTPVRILGLRENPLLPGQVNIVEDTIRNVAR